MAKLGVNRGLFWSRLVKTLIVGYRSGFAGRRSSQKRKKSTDLRGLLEGSEIGACHFQASVIRLRELNHCHKLSKSSPV